MCQHWILVYWLPIRSLISESRGGRRQGWEPEALEEVKRLICQHLCRLTVRPVSKLFVVNSHKYYSLISMSFQAQLSPDPHTHRMLLLKTSDREKMATKLFMSNPTLWPCLFSHEVENEFYIPNHEKLPLDCLLTELVAQSLFPFSAPPFDHRRLENKSTRQAWPKYVLWTDSFTTICKWDSLVPTLIIPYQLGWV